MGEQSVKTVCIGTKEEGEVKGRMCACMMVDGYVKKVCREACRESGGALSACCLSP